MPQTIPLEASETLAFTPPSLDGIEGAPVFTLRYPTRRDKRFVNRLLRESGARHHSDKEIRVEILAELKRSWTEADYEKFAPIVEAYWQAIDDHALLLKTDPATQFEHDEETSRTTENLIRLVAGSSASICKMEADNAEFNELLELCNIAVIVSDWTGLNVRQQRERGYFTIDCAGDLLDGLTAYAGKALGSERAAMPYAELVMQSFRQLRMDGEEEKNSVSPSPSETPQTNSKTDSDLGASKASAISPTTPEAA